jgi:hypothetical protein
MDGRRGKLMKFVDILERSEKRSIGVIWMDWENRVCGFLFLMSDGICHQSFLVRYNNIGGTRYHSHSFLCFQRNRESRNSILLCRNNWAGLNIGGAVYG